METNQKEAMHKKIFIAAIIFLALANTVTIYFLFSERHAKNEVIVQKTELQGTYTNLEKDYHQLTDSMDAASLSIGQLKGKNSDLDKIITEKQAMMEQAKQDLDNAYRNNTLTQSALSKARTMISQYESSIAQLEKKVEEFAEKNQHLTAQNVKLDEDLSCEKETTENLSNKLTVASYLQIPKVEVEAVKKNLRGNEVPTSRVKATESLKISFETGVNKALEPGNVSLYVRIINPKGETIAVKEQGSGVITADNSKPVQYTKKADIHYNQQNRKVVMYWTRYIQDPGTYRVEVYQSGKVVGKGAVKLV